MEEIYRGYGQDALNAQYDLRPLWSDVPEVIAHRENESARVRNRIPGRLDIAYGDGPGEILDVFPPSNRRGGSPALIYIHGGYWQLSDKSDTSYIAPAFLSAGISFVTLNYTLAPRGTLRQVDECAAQSSGSGATRRDRRRPDRFSCRSFRGQSQRDDTDDELTDVDGEPRNPIKGRAPFPLYDMEPIRLCFVNDALGLTPDDVPHNSPLYLDPLVDIPLIQSVRRSKRTNSSVTRPNMRRSAKNLAVEEIPAPDCHHYDCRTFR